MAMTKAEYETQGRIAAKRNREDGGARTNPLTPGSWQAHAWMRGYQSVYAVLPKPASTAAGPGIEIGQLLNLTDGLLAPRRAHVTALATDYNSEVRQPRRLRLFKAIGRVLERHGIKSPIPMTSQGAQA